MLQGESTKREFSIFSLIKSWEFTLLVVLIIVFIVNTNLSSNFLKINNLIDTSLIFMEKSILALPMTLIIMTGFIDISIASIVAMTGVVLATCFNSGVNIWVSVIIALSVGLIAGLLNGVIITKLKIPSIVVTLGTMLFYRGIAYILLGDNAISGFPEKFGILGGAYNVTFIPIQLIIFIILVIIFGLILHKTTFGRQLYAIGNNEDACRYSGIPVDRIRVILFTIMGFVSGLCGVLLTSRIMSARPDIATGYELKVITIVVLGGVAIFGGKGSILGVTIATFIVGYLSYGLSIINIQSPIINIFIGLILIITLLVPTIVAVFRDMKGSLLKKFNSRSK
jgi:rhamnose transport system permease protein